jgi:hypothetical protein
MKNDEKREFLTFCVSLSLFHSVFCFGLFDILRDRKIQHFNTHKREKKRGDFFSSSSSHALITHTEDT